MRRSLLIFSVILSLFMLATPRQAHAGHGGGGGLEVLLTTLVPITTTAEIVLAIYYPAAWVLSTTSSPFSMAAQLRGVFLRENRFELAEALTSGGGEILRDVFTIYAVPPQRERLFVRRLRTRRVQVFALLARVDQDTHALRLDALLRNLAARPEVWP